MVTVLLKIRKKADLKKLQKTKVINAIGLDSKLLSINYIHRPFFFLKYPWEKRRLFWNIVENFIADIVDIPKDENILMTLLISKAHSKVCGVCIFTGNFFKIQVDFLAFSEFIKSKYFSIQDVLFIWLIQAFCPH